VSATVETALHPELVPFGFAKDSYMQNQSVLRHLRWMLQKVRDRMRR
jgi:hypothetical protein